MILDRMLLKMHLRYLLIALAVLWILVMIGEFFESARYLLSGKGSASDVLMYFFCRTLVLLRLLLPIAWVVATCLVFATLGCNLELRALAAAGVGPFRMTAAILCMGLGIVVITIGAGEYLVPSALERIETLMREKFGRFDSTWRYFSRHHWFQGEGERFFYIGQTLQDGRELRNVILLEMDSDFHVQRRADIKRVVQRNGKWVGHGATIREFAQGRVDSYRQVGKQQFDWPERPEHFRTLIGRPAQKPFDELVSHIKELKRRGLSSVEYRLELHNRFAFPLLGWFLILFVFPWITMPFRQSSLAGALIQATALIFGAYLLVGLTNAAVSGGSLDVVWGAWLPVAVVALISLPKWICVLHHRQVQVDV